MQDPLELAKLAALLNPQLAFQDPVRAVEHAHRLWLAARERLAGDSSDEWIAAAAREADATVGSAYLPLPDLFEKYGSLTQYKNLGNFTEALKREGLVDSTPSSFHGSPEQKSSLAAVQLLVQIQADRKRAQDRARKNQSKSSAEIPARKAERSRS